MDKLVLILFLIGAIFVIIFVFVNPLMGGAVIIAGTPFIIAAIINGNKKIKISEELKFVISSFQNEKEEITEEIKRKETRQKEQFELLRKFSQDLAGAQNKDELTRLIINMFAKMTQDSGGDSQCFLLCHDPGTEEFEYSIGCNIDRNSLKSLRFNTSDKLLAQLIKTKKIYTDLGDVFGGGSQLTSFLKGQRPAALARLSSLAMIPLILENEVWGIIVIFCGEQATLRIKREEGFFLLLVAQAALALGSAIHRGLASIDRLTQLYNRTFLQKRMREELEFCNRQKVPLSFLMIDIDHFKNINDTYGHHDGDMVLKKIAQILSKNIRITDICARFGGEEFVVVLPGMIEKTADKFSIADRLRQYVEAEEFVVQNDKKIDLTISVGVAVRQYPEDKEVGLDELLKRADEKLYQAKREGRNKVCYP